MIYKNGTFKVKCIKVTGDSGEFSDLIGKKGKLTILGADAEFNDVDLIEIKMEIKNKTIKIKTSYDNTLIFEIQ